MTEHVTVGMLTAYFWKLVENEINEKNENIWQSDDVPDLVRLIRLIRSDAAQRFYLNLGASRHTLTLRPTAVLHTTAGLPISQPGQEVDQ